MTPSGQYGSGRYCIGLATFESGSGLEKHGTSSANPGEFSGNLGNGSRIREFGYGIDTHDGNSEKRGCICSGTSSGIFHTPGKAIFILTFWYRAFGLDNRVARLNCEVDWDRDWSEPSLFATLVRGITYPIKKCWLVTKKSLSNLGHYVRNLICVSSHTRHTQGDVESGERENQEEVETPEETSMESPGENVQKEFRRALEDTFSEAKWVDEIRWNIEQWEYGL